MQNEVSSTIHLLNLGLLGYAACGDSERKAQVARYASTKGVRAAVRHFSVKFSHWHSSCSPILASYSHARLNTEVLHLSLSKPKFAQVSQVQSSPT